MYYSKEDFIIDHINAFYFIMLYTKSYIYTDVVSTITVVDTWTRASKLANVVVLPMNHSIIVRNAEDPYAVVCVYPRDGIQFSDSEAMMYELKGTVPFVECAVFF